VPESSLTTNLRQQRRRQTRLQILDSAGRVFGQSGFDAASMADIAEDAGLKKALVQYHFETKENLWKAAVTHLWQRRDEMIPGYIDSGGSVRGADALRDIFTAIVTFTRHHPEWITLMFRESSNPGPRLDWLIEKFLREDIERGCSFIEIAQERGMLPAASPLQLLHLISGALSYNLLIAPMTARATGVDLASEASVTEQVEVLINLLGDAGPKPRQKISRGN
jgi:TetR/AcrR family transcriptional regulator